MERAGVGLANAVMRLFKKERGQITIVCGRGNNGGDGLVAARHLLSAGYDVHVTVLAGIADLSPDARANWEVLAPMTAHLEHLQNETELQLLAQTLARSQCAVDAILGTGLSKSVQGLAGAAINLMNSLKVPVVAADVPSGLSADTGLPQGSAVRAIATVTFGLPKAGLFLGRGPDFSGDLEVVPIGIPEDEIAKIDTKLELIEPEMFANLFIPRRPDSHKGNYGHVAVFAGSRGHLGAGYLVCLAALRSGSGLATYCIPEKAFVRFDSSYSEIMCDVIPDDGLAAFAPGGLDAAIASLKGKTAMAVGPAIGTASETREFVNAFLKKADLPVVIDADALNVLEPESIKSRKFPAILTPHPGELGRLLRKSVDEIQKDRIAAAVELSKLTGGISVLKGRGTVVATPDGRAAINLTGNAGMATAGMGDALAGIIVSFLGQGMEARPAAMAAVHIHGLAGDLAAAEVSQRALVTGDVIRKLGSVFKQWEQGVKS
jgi:NAD(P)H-hydrate epimerase